jgi:hypothetical protein
MMMLRCALMLVASAQATAQPPAPQASTAEAPQLVVSQASAPASNPAAIVLAKDTMVRLMVLNEVNSHNAKVGDRFVLRVDEAVAVGGTILIPVGAKAWAEVTEVKENGAFGRSGKMGARLLYVEARGSRIPVLGDQESKGNAGGDRVAFAVVGFGPFGLLARGTQGKLKAGAIFNGYVGEDWLFDPAAQTFLAPGVVAAAP